MSHKRIIPRDFFNESKLLKCLGRLELTINHTGPNPLKLRSEHDGEPFDIVQDPSDASLSVANYKVFFGDTELKFFTPYNAKSNYPLFIEWKGETYHALSEDGEPLMDFFMEDLCSGNGV